ncbi:hypothetical protein DFJ74DRAFT_712061 [Hyaloraphidium curvatum]|nr:hypothetical protein DFJ74DRAFT_712061 [Hyaloraphidium curvatum]
MAPEPFANPDWPKDIVDVQLGSQIYPHLFLGSVNAVCVDPDPLGAAEFLRARRVTHILTVAAEPTTMPDVPAIEKALGRPIGWMHLPKAADNPTYAIIEDFELANEYIEGVLRPYYAAVAQKYLDSKKNASNRAPVPATKGNEDPAPAKDGGVVDIPLVPGQAPSPAPEEKKRRGSFSKAIGAITGTVGHVAGAVGSAAGSAVRGIDHAVGGLARKLVHHAPDSVDKILPAEVQPSEEVAAAIARGMSGIQASRPKSPQRSNSPITLVADHALEDLLEPIDPEEHALAADADGAPEISGEDTAAQHAQWEKDSAEYFRRPYKVADLPDPLGKDGENYPVLFIHCQMGISRSATIATQHLMKLGAAAPYLIRLLTGQKRKFDYHGALEYIHARRPVAMPNSGFRLQLQIWERMGSQKVRKDTDAWRFYETNRKYLLHRIEVAKEALAMEEAARKERETTATEEDKGASQVAPTAALNR